MQDREAGLFDCPKTLECTADEGVNVIRFDWVGNQHGAVKNTDHWMMSCFGLGNKCSEECEGTLETGFIVTHKAWVEFINDVQGNGKSDRLET